MRLSCPRAAGALAVGALTFLGRDALARPRLAVARSEQASSCPDTAALTAQVEAVLGRPALTRPAEGSPALSFDVEVSAAGEGFAATIRVNGSRQGKRELRDDGPGCTGLGDALAVTLAMLLDERPREPQPGAPPPVDTSPGPITVLPAPAWTSHLRLWLGGGVATGLTFSTEPVLAGGVWLGVGRLLLGLDAFGLPASRFDLPPGSVSVSLLGATARGCWPLVRERWLAFHGCAVLAAGRFSATGVDYRRIESAHPAWGAGGVGLLAGGPVGLPRLSWLARVDGLATVREQAFNVRDVGPTPALPRVSLTAVVGVAVSIW